MLASVKSDGRAGRSAYVHGIGFGPRVRDASSTSPAKRHHQIDAIRLDTRINLLAMAANR